MPPNQRTSFRKIAAVLRREWFADWQPGAQIPTNRELVARFASTPITVQRAMDLLAEQGVILRRPTVGSYLAARPPAECQVGLVFPGHPETIVDWTWSLHYLAALSAAERLNAADGRWRIRFYMDVSPESHGTGGGGLQRLQRDLADGVLGGIIYSYTPFDLRGSDILTKPGVPVVLQNPKFAAPGMGIRVEPAAMTTALATWSASTGARSPAVITIAKKSPNEIRDILDAAGLTFRPELVQVADHYHLEWIHASVAALFRSDATRPPDSLLILDDHLVEPAVEALYELAPSGLDALPIFGHWNFPLPFNGHLPITLHGYDAELWLQTALELIERHPEPARTRGPISRIKSRTVHLPALAGREADSPSIVTLISTAKELLQWTVA